MTQSPILKANALPWLLLGGCLVLAFVLGMATGSYAIQWVDFHDFSPTRQDWIVLWEIRLPRILLSGIVGCILAIAGASLQGLFRNPLADPGLIGISSGAALAVAILIVVLPTSGGWMGLYGISVAAFIGGLLTSYFIFRIGRRTSGNVLHLILAGVAINAIAAAGVGFLTYLSNDQQLRTLTFWTMGSFGGALWPVVIVTLSLGIPAILLLQRQASALNRLLLGEQEAAYLGTDVQILKRNIILLTSLAVGVAVAMSGIIGFVGLVVPHLVRLVWKADHRVLLPASAILGAVLTIVADTVARTIVSPAEMPVGIITSLVGGPFFLWLLYRSLHIERGM